MDCALICNKDAPEICQRDIMDLIGKTSSVFPSVCVVSDVSLEEVAILSYYCQSAYKVVPLLFSVSESFIGDDGEFDINSLDDILSKKAPSSLCEAETRLVADASSFSCRVSKLVDSDIPTTDFEALIGGWYHDRVSVSKHSLSVDLDNPDLPVHCIVTGDTVMVGVDVIGFDLSKRPYKLLPYPSSLNGVMAYTLARLVGVGRESVVLDPFCGSGTIPIELGLFQNGISPFALENSFSGLSIPLFNSAFEKVRERTSKQELSVKDRVTGYDNQFKVMTQAKKHAKIAHVKDAITISKVDIDWVDMKFEADSVDVIVTNPPKENRKTNNRKDIMKLYDEFCYQIRHLLKPSGVAGVLLVKPELLVEAAKPHNLSVDEVKSIHSGEQEYQLVLLSKKSDAPKSWD